MRLAVRVSILAPCLYLCNSKNIIQEDGCVLLTLSHT